MLGRDFWELFPESVGSVFDKSKRRAMESGEASSAEAYDATLGLWVEERDYPSSEGVTVLLSDITPLKQAESARREADEGLDASRSEYRLLFRTMSAGLAVHEIVTDPAGRPVDYRFIEVNPAFEHLTGLRATEIVGRTAREVLPDLEDSWIETYGEVALNGRRASFESYAAPLERHYEVIAYSPSPGRFATIFTDITERKRIEEERRRRLEESQVMAQQLEAQGAELRSRSEELEAQAGEAACADREAYRTRRPGRGAERDQPPGPLDPRFRRDHAARARRRRAGSRRRLRHDRAARGALLGGALPARSCRRGHRSRA